MAKRYISLIIALIISVLFICSWVDPRTVDIYDADIFIYDNTYGVTDLSGSIQFFLHSYDGLAFSDSGYVYNTLGSNITGRALINGSEYSIRINSFGGLSVQQTYYNGYERTVWQTYNMTMSKLPGSIDISDDTFIITVIGILILALLAIKVFLK